MTPAPPHSDVDTTPALGTLEAAVDMPMTAPFTQSMLPADQSLPSTPEFSPAPQITPIQASAITIPGGSNNVDIPEKLPSEPSIITSSDPPEPATAPAKKRKGPFPYR